MVSLKGGEVFETYVHIRSLAPPLPFFRFLHFQIPFSRFGFFVNMLRKSHTLAQPLFVRIGFFVKNIYLRLPQTPSPDPPPDPPPPSPFFFKFGFFANSKKKTLAPYPPFFSDLDSLSICHKNHLILPCISDLIV